MNKKTWGIIIVVIIIIVIALIASSGGDGTPGDGDLSGDSAESFSGSIQDLISRGKDITCTFESTMEEGSIAGTVYISGERVRGDYLMTQGEETEFETSSIMDGEYVYTWGQTPGGVMATKIAVPEEGEVVETTEGPTATPSPDQNFEYDCDSWSVDESVFTPPSDIEFQDLSAMFDEVIENAPEAPQVDCSVCDTLPDGPQKSECLAALGC